MTTRIILSLLFIASALSASAQKMETYKEKWAHIKYQIPENWAVDPFSSSSVCDCPGIINLDYDKDIQFVIYPVTKDSLDSDKRYEVWDYRFIPSNKVDVVRSENMKFKRTVSAWENDEKGYEVWRLETIYKGNGLIIYFWMMPETIEREAKLIDEIITNLEGLK